MHGVLHREACFVLHQFLDQCCGELTSRLPSKWCASEYDRQMALYERDAAKTEEGLIKAKEHSFAREECLLTWQAGCATRPFLVTHEAIRIDVDGPIAKPLRYFAFEVVAQDGKKVDI